MCCFSVVSSGFCSEKITNKSRTKRRNEIQFFFRTEQKKKRKRINNPSEKSPPGRRNQTAMPIWKRAAGAIKDKNSLLRANLSRRTPHRNPELEAAIIRATSHSDLCFDYRRAKIVYTWIRTSPASLSPLMSLLGNRMEKTRSWAVALKGLMLVHGVLRCNSPAAKQLGRLHFDLSTFTDGHSRPEKTWGFDVFIRAYFTFLDLRLVYEFQDGGERAVVREMVDLQKRQTLLGLLLQVGPTSANMRVGLILDAMDYVLAEVSEIHSRISRGIAKLAWKIDSSSKLEAAMALQILQKAAAQGEELFKYFEHCEDFGIVNASGNKEFPVVPKIPEEDIKKLEGIINGGPKKKEKELGDSHKAMVVGEESKLGRLKTIITEKWEVFEDDLFDFSEQNSNAAGEEEALEVSRKLPPLEPIHLPSLHPCNIPDLITFE